MPRETRQSDDPNKPKNQKTRPEARAGWNIDHYRSDASRFTSGGGRPPDAAGGSQSSRVVSTLFKNHPHQLQQIDQDSLPLLERERMQRAFFPARPFSPTKTTSKNITLDQLSHEELERLPNEELKKLSNTEESARIAKPLDQLSHEELERLPNEELKKLMEDD